MIIIYLDQCAISNLAIARTRDDKIDELKKLMLEASRNEALICPVAVETLAETTGLPAKCRILIHDLHSYLAGARSGSPCWAFKSMWKIINEETLALARSEFPPTPYELFQWQNIDDDLLAENASNELKTGKIQMENRVKSHQIATDRQGISKNPTKKRVGFEHVSHVYRQIQRLLKDEELCPDDHMGYEVGKYLKERGITKQEIGKISEDIRNHLWEAIPVIFYRTQLATQLETELIKVGSSRKYKANDEFDIPRLAVGLASADVIITDAPMAQLCRTVKTSRWTHAKVFSVRETKEIIAHLEDTLS